MATTKKPTTNGGKKTTTKKTATRTKKIAANTGMGVVVWYEFSGAAISVVDLNTILAAEGMGSAPEINLVKAVKDCGRSFRLGRGKSDDKYMGEIAFEDDDQVVISIMKKVRPGEKKVSYDQVDSLVWDKKAVQGTDPWLSRGTNKDDSVISAIEVLLRKIAHAQTYLGHEFLRPWLIQAELNASGAMKLKNSGGGLYYVTEAQMERVNRLERVCHAIAGVDLSILDISHSDRGKASVERGVKNNMYSALAELQEKIAEWSDSSRRPRSDATGSVMIQFKELRDQLSLYSEALKISMADVEAALDDSQKVLVNLITRQSESKASPGLVAKYKSLIDGGKPDSNGTYFFDIKTIQAAGIPSSGSSHRSYYSPDNGAGRALRELGYSGRLDMNIGVTITPLVKTQDAASAA